MDSIHIIAPRFDEHKKRRKDERRKQGVHSPFDEDERRSGKERRSFRLDGGPGSGPQPSGHTRKGPNRRAKNRRTKQESGFSKPGSNPSDPLSRSGKDRRGETKEFAKEKLASARKERANLKRG